MVKGIARWNKVSGKGKLIKANSIWLYSQAGIPTNYDGIFTVIRIVLGRQKTGEEKKKKC